ncbi:MAG: DUF5119 domain-containing protein [Bacteroidales bacterium]
MKTIGKLMFILSFILYTGCTNKELCPDCEPQEGVEIKFDWKYADAIPSGMTVLFYSMDDQLIYTFNNVPPKGEMIAIKAGKYKVACYNNDTEYVQWSGEDNLDSLHVSSRTTEISGIPGVNDSGESLVAVPDLLYGDVLSQTEILPFRPGIQIVLLTPEPIPDYYTYQVSSIVNSKYVTKVQATLSGLSNSYYPANPDYQIVSAVIPFKDNEMNIAQEMATGEMINLGNFKARAVKNILTLYLWTPAGNFRAVYDVTDQVVNAPDPHHVHIIIKTSIIIPPPIEGGEGLDPSVDEWKDINYDIIL